MLLYFSGNVQKYPRGRRGSPAKGGGVEKAREGSNPSFCATKRAHICVLFSIVEYSESYRSGHNEAVLKTVWANAHVGSNPTLSARHCKIPKSLKLRDFLYLSMDCGVFASYIFQRNHAKISVTRHVLTCDFTSKFTTTFLCVFEDAYSFLDCHVFALAACGF